MGYFPTFIVRPTEWMFKSDDDFIELFGKTIRTNMLFREKIEDMLNKKLD